MILIASTAVVASGASVIVAYQRSGKASNEILASSQREKLFPKTVPLVPAFERFVTIRAESGIDPLPKKTVKQIRKFATISANVASAYRPGNIIDEKKLLKAFDAYWKTFNALEHEPNNFGYSSSGYSFTAIMDTYEMYSKAAKIQKQKMGEDFVLLMCQMIDVTFYHHIKKYLDSEHGRRGRLEYFENKFSDIAETGLEEWKVLL